MTLSVLQLRAQQAMNADQLERIMANPQAQILDVRTPSEFQDGHIPNAVNADWQDQESFLKQVQDLDRTQPVYVYCLSGGRSQQAADYLTEKGFSVHNYEGGMLDWRQADKPEINNPSSQNSPGLSTDAYEKIIAASPLVLVNFSASWCAPCQELKPIIDQIDEEHNDTIKVVRLDADENKSLTRVLNVKELPQLMLYHNGKIVWAHQGLVSKEEILQQVAEIN